MVTFQASEPPLTSWPAAEHPHRGAGLIGRGIHRHEAGSDSLQSGVWGHEWEGAVAWHIRSPSLVHLPSMALMHNILSGAEDSAAAILSHVGPQGAKRLQG